MHDPSIRNPAYQALTDQQLSEIDALCDRFDQELVEGGAPCIETFLAEVSETARVGLLAELLAMEVEHRTKTGDEPQQDDYIQRFPEQKGVIAGVFARDATTHYPGKDTISLPVSVSPVLANFRLIKELGRGGMGGCLARRTGPAGQTSRCPQVDQSGAELERCDRPVRRRETSPGDDGPSQYRARA